MSGGSAAAFGRVAAEMLGRHIPGKPTVISSGDGGCWWHTGCDVHLQTSPPRTAQQSLIPTDSIGISQFVQPDQAKGMTPRSFTWLGTFNQTRFRHRCSLGYGRQNRFIDLRDKADLHDLLGKRVPDRLLPARNQWTASGRK